MNLPTTLLVLTAGCGRIAFDPRGADASPDAPPLDPVGQLDPSFGGTGVLQPSSTAESIAFDIALRGDGYVLLGTDYQPGMEAMLSIALTESGAHDAGWDGDGELVARSAASATAFGYGAYALPDGDFLFMGDGSYGANGDDFNLSRVHGDGTPAVFGVNGDGFANFNIPPGLTGDTARRAVSLADTLFVCGNSDYTVDIRFAMVAVRADGTLEPSFQSGGILTENLSAGPDECRDVVTDGGRLVATGRVNGAIAIFAVEPLGADPLVPTSSAIVGTPRAIVRGRDEHFVVAAATATDGVLLRFTPALVSDSSFGTGGSVISAGDELFDLVIDSMGRLLVVGRRDGSGFVARFQADGSVDTSFGTNGAFVLDLPGLLYSVVIDKVGRIVAVGATNDATGSHMLALRLL